MNETELLFTHILNCDRASLYLNRDMVLDEDKLDFISSSLKRRIKGEPIQYILGKTEFMGLDFKVNNHVLIPRPETEILVETCLFLGTPFGPIGRVSPRILDLGTGSGCIAISLAKHLPDASIDASDISGQALKVAQENAILNGVKINFIESDLFENNLMLSKDYDIIISNPPYVSTSQIRDLQPEVRYEPVIALNGGIDGLDFYRRIIKEAANFLRDKGYLVIEIGFGQTRALEEIISNSKLFEIVKVVKDYNSIERVVVARKVAING